MALPVINSNSDNVIRLTLTDGNGDAINPSSLISIEVAVYQKKEAVLQKWESVTVVDGANGVCEVYLDRANLNKINSGRLYIQIAAEITNTSFAGNVERILSNPKELADISISVL